MPDRWKILAPVDLGYEGEARVQHALNVAEALQGDLTLLYVIDGPPELAGRVEWPRNATASRHDVNVRRLVLTGGVAKTVGRYGNDLGADLVTLTARSNSWWKRLWRRSAAAEIAAATDRPVCLTRLSVAGAMTPLRSVLAVVALDGTDDPLIRFSEEVAERCDATLVILHVVPEATEALLALGVPGTEDRPLSKEVAERRMRDLTATLAHPHLTAITTGSAYRSVADVARENNVDVVITGRRDGALLSIGTDTLLSRVSRPVISVPTGPGRLFGSNPAYSSRDASRTGAGMLTLR